MRRFQTLFSITSPKPLSQKMISYIDLQTKILLVLLFFSLYYTIRTAMIFLCFMQGAACGGGDSTKGNFLHFRQAALPEFCFIPNNLFFFGRRGRPHAPCAAPWWYAWELDFCPLEISIGNKSSGLRSYANNE